MAYPSSLDELTDGVPSDGAAPTTALDNATYPHDDHHRALATAVEVDAELDPALGLEMRRGLGFNLGGMGGNNLRFGSRTSERTFGHGGAGTSICWADKDLDAAMVFIPNGFRGDETNVPRARSLSDAVRKACAALASA